MSDLKRYRTTMLYPSFTHQEQTHVRMNAALSRNFSPDVIRETVFHQVHGGGIVGRTAEFALKTAKALQHARSQDWEFRWDFDSDADYSFMETWPEPDQKRWNRDSHSAEYCQLVDENGSVLASLSGIIDADDNYRRVVEGDLALEAWKTA